MIALEVRALAKSFGGLRVSADVSFAVEAGERRLIIGPNGAGKTTLFNLITGELRPDSGSVHFFGQDITAVPASRRAPRGEGPSSPSAPRATGPRHQRGMFLANMATPRSRSRPRES